MLQHTAELDVAARKKQERADHLEDLRYYAECRKENRSFNAAGWLVALAFILFIILVIKFVGPIDKVDRESRSGALPVVKTIAMAAAPSEVMRPYTVEELPALLADYRKQNGLVMQDTDMARLYNRYKSSIEKAIVKVYNVDMNNDGLINCIDYTIQFFLYFDWDEPLPLEPEGSSVRVIWNHGNPNGFNHLFVMLGEVAYEPGANINRRYSYDAAGYWLGITFYWGKRYDAKYNEDVTDDFINIRDNRNTRWSENYGR
jgi:YD repeat-containing protein